MLTNERAHRIISMSHKHWCEKWYKHIKKGALYADTEFVC